MAYLALYREWRPRKFSDVVGQKHVVQTLLNALIAEKLSHAYLFCGSRGTGKTSIAKILASAANCLEPLEGNPCGQCEVCLEIEKGTCMDVTEIDAASHRGIEEVREIREQVRFSPSLGKKRVIIIDEVHMLTNEAFNALLKTLEEPPSHAIFILATTEPAKIPLTILSRCQRFDFHRISSSDLLERLKKVALSAKISIDSEALSVIVRASEGSMRDALSILDQAAAYCGNDIEGADIYSLLGAVREDLLATAADGIVQGNTKVVLELIGQLVDQGKDLRIFLKETIANLHSVLLGLLESGSPGIDRLTEIIRILAKAEREMQWSTQPRVILEVAVIRAARIAEAGHKNGNIDKILSRVGELETMLSRLSVKSVSGNSPPYPPTNSGFLLESEEKGIEKMLLEPESNPAREILPAEDKQAESQEALKAEKEEERGIEVAPVAEDKAKDEEITNKEGNESLEKITARWNDILQVAQRACPHIAAHLSQGKGWPVELEGAVLSIGFPKKESYTSLAIGILDSETNLKEIAKLIKSVCQIDVTARVVLSDKKSSLKVKKPKKSVNPDDMEMIFGKGQDILIDKFDGFED
ncbi:MAG: DNA polymerase III subunit gamma/tau [Peptococcaceae bacterium]|nr:DNA polymerase III subunit gamma/tau [Peptococcaceae bacterium]